MPQQILMIHGGTTFKIDEEYFDYLKNKKIESDRLVVRDRWTRNLAKDLGEDYLVLTPKMPNSTNARYEEWKTWFENILTVLDKELILIGHSLGGIFLVKYLSENKIDKTIKAAFLLGAPFDDDLGEESLADFVLPEDLSGFSDQVEKMFFLHSKDDPCVPCEHVFKYQKKLPEAKLILFLKAGHFNEEELSGFAKMIKQL